MQLPAHYTVHEVIERLEIILLGQQKELENAKVSLEEEKKPKYKRTWFGYYKDVTNYPMFLCDWHFGYHVQFCEESVSETNKQLSALRKLPIDAKVKLTVEEINELFNNGENE